MSISKVRLPNNTEEDIKAKYLIQSTSSDATSAEFSARAVSEDAIANIQKIYGNTVKWNQLVNTSTLSSSGSHAAISYSYSNGIITAVSGTASSTSFSGTALGNITVPLTMGHKYYLGKGGGTSQKRIQLYSASAGNRSYETLDAPSIVFTCEYSATDWIIRVRIAQGTTVNNDKFTFNVVDLTAIYGSGNEPTVSEFEAQYPAAYYPYSPPTLLSNSATSIQSKDSGDNIIGNCDLNIPTLTGKLNGTGSSVVIFPDGMGYDGENRDELTLLAALKKTGCVDLGDLTWSALANNPGKFYAQVSGVKASTKNIICAKYSNASAWNSISDKQGAITSPSFGATDRYFIYDTDFSSYSAAQVKTALSGVSLVYELATPEEYTPDNTLQLQYPVVAGGTEMVLPTTGTAPMKMDVIYGNAADATSNLSSNFISVDSMKAFLNNLGTQMGGTWNMQYNNGKFEFTFSSS